MKTGSLWWMDGFCEIVDRKDNMIISTGEHVYPSEVEEVIDSHPEVEVLGSSVPALSISPQFEKTSDYQRYKYEGNSNVAQE